MTPERRARLARPLVPAALAVAVLLALAGAALASESPSPAGSGGPTPSGGTAISIVQKTFQPASATIHVGDTVTWTVTEAIAEPHSVTSGTPTDAKPGTVFDSGTSLRQNGDAFSHTFDAAGTYAFFCAVHPDTMRGTITVEASGGPGEGDTAVPALSKLIAAGVLAAALVVLLGWAWLFRRMNPAPR